VHCTMSIGTNTRRQQEQSDEREEDAVLIAYTSSPVCSGGVMFVLVVARSESTDARRSQLQHASPSGE
jgi:hypothetical protein